MASFFIAAGISIALILACVAIFYEILAHVWVRLPRLEGRPRTQILITIFSAFVGHTLAVWIFGVTFYLLDRFAQFGTLKGEIDHRILDYVYFSAVSYSSLGLGDIYPTGGLEMLIGVEAILGLILIGWTVTFTYIVTDRYLTKRLERHGRSRKQ